MRDLGRRVRAAGEVDRASEAGLATSTDSVERATAALGAELSVGTSGDWSGV